MVAKMTNKDDRGSTGFLGGLVLGLSLGSLLAYFATPEGKKTWRKLAKEWDKAKVELHEQGLLSDVNLSLAEFKDELLLQFKQTLLGAKDQLGLLKLDLDQAKEREKTRKKRSRSRQKNKFKGI